ATGRRNSRGDPGAHALQDGRRASGSLGRPAASPRPDTPGAGPDGRDPGGAPQGGAREYRRPRGVPAAVSGGSVRCGRPAGTGQRSVADAPGRPPYATQGPVPTPGSLSHADLPERGRLELDAAGPL